MDPTSGVAYGLMSPIPLAIPQEIINHIFVVGCKASRRFCLTLSYTSSWTRRLALPYLYSIMVLDMKGFIYVFQTILQMTPIYDPPPGFIPGKQIRGLWVDDAISYMLEILHTCTNLQHLALTPRTLLGMSLRGVQPSHGVARFKNLFIFDAESEREPRLGSDVTRYRPDYFDSVTHLRIGKVGEYTTLLDLSSFRRATHIAVPYHNPEKHNLNDLLPVLDKARLEVFVLVIWADQLSDAHLEEALKWVADAQRPDIAVLAVLSSGERLLDEWEQEVRNEITIWERAMAFSRQRVVSDIVSSIASFKC